MERGKNSTVVKAELNKIDANNLNVFAPLSDMLESWSNDSKAKIKFNVDSVYVWYDGCTPIKLYRTKEKLLGGLITRYFYSISCDFIVQRISEFDYNYLYNLLGSKIAIADKAKKTVL